MFLPAAAERLVEIDQIEQARVFGLDEILPRVVIGLLGGENVERTVNAAAETRLGQFVSLLFAT